MIDIWFYDNASFPLADKINFCSKIEKFLINYTILQYENVCMFTNNIVE